MGIATSLQIPEVGVSGRDGGLASVGFLTVSSGETGNCLGDVNFGRIGALYKSHAKVIRDRYQWTLALRLFCKCGDVCPIGLHTTESPRSG